MGGVVKKAKKLVKKVIPKEIKPALPYIAAFYGQPYLAKGLGSVGTFALNNPAVTKALISGATSAVTDDNPNILRSAALAAAPDLISGGLGNVAQKINPNIIGDYDEIVKVGKTATRAAGALQKASEGIKGASALKTIGTQAAVDSAAKLAEIQQDEIDKYNEQLRKQGVLEKTKRRTSIYNIYINAGYEPEYVNSMLDRYGYDEGGLVKALKAIREKMRAPETIAKQMSGNLRRKPKDDDIMTPPKKPKDPKDNDEEEPVLVKEVDKDLAGGLMAAARGVEQAFGIPFSGVAPAEFKRFAQGGEVEIEEETDDLNILDFMKDQGIEYGEQASYGFDEAMADSFDMFQDYRKKGLIPMDMEFDEFLEIMRDSKKSKDGIMQMASGYKTDIEEMYEQYVFEMEEQGLTPMSFSEFLKQARAGMKDGGKAKRRKKGQEDDSDVEKPGPRRFPKLEDKMLYEEKMPQVMPGNKPDMMDAAMGGIASMADGGIMEKDMRGGGFIPEGTKERADDVPARLSKNEFVMTADAVRAAGGGSVNQGAKRMYDMMYQLEGKA